MATIDINDCKDPFNAYQQLSPDVKGEARVEFIRKNYEAAVWLKGLDVVLERAIKCPCANLNDTSPLSSCLNCGGSGYLYINPTRTRMILQSMNLDTKYKEWSEEKVGSVKITARQIDDISFMDRVTVLNTSTTTKQILFPKKYNIKDRKLLVKTIYPADEVLDMFQFVDSKKALVKLEENADYVVRKNEEGKLERIIEFNEKFYDIENFTVSIRYKHCPQFHVIDLVRDISSTRVVDKNTGLDAIVDLPVHGVGRRSHYVIDVTDFSGDLLIDNSYEIDDCCDDCDEDEVKNIDTIITSLNTSQPELTWILPNDGETGFILQRSVGNENNFKQIAILDSNITTFVDSDSSIGITYYYRLATIKDNKQSEFTNIANIKTV